MREATICCPHCKGKIVVRETTGPLSAEKQKAIWAEADRIFGAANRFMDDMSASMDRMFKSAFKK